MGQKVFMTRDRYTLWGDERDVAVSSDLRKEVYFWCVENSITADMPLDSSNRYISEKYFGVDIWRVRDDQQRLMFVLKWI